MEIERMELNPPKLPKPLPLLEALTENGIRHRRHESVFELESVKLEPGGEPADKKTQLTKTTSS